jgi:hypothetical protein
MTASYIFKNPNIRGRYLAKTHLYKTWTLRTRSSQIPVDTREASIWKVFRVTGEAKKGTDALAGKR